MTIQSILDRKGCTVFTTKPAATVRDAADQMRKHCIASLVIQSGDAIMGMVSEHDIVSAVSRFGGLALSMSVMDVQTRILVTVAPCDSIKRTMGLMTHHRVRQLPVIADGKLAGIVSIGDIVKHRLEDLERESNVPRDAHIAAH